MQTGSRRPAVGITRRHFLGRSAQFVGSASLSALVAAEPPQPKLRAAVMGHTGRGDYGHGLEVIFRDLPGVEVVALADPDAAGREAAAKRAGALRSYADYRELLEKERPQLVSVAPRWTDQHQAMALAALKAGA